MTARPNIVFVHVGPRLPAHLPVALDQVRRFNGGSLWLVASAKALAQGLPGMAKGQVQTVSCEDLGLSGVHRRFHQVTIQDRKFRNGFWLHTTERFFFLENLMDRAGLSHVFHLENDVMLYADLGLLAPVFDRCYPAMAATFDAPGRCVPGFVYARDHQAVSRLTRFVVKVFETSNRTVNDMALLAGFRSTFGAGAMDTLPVVPKNCPHLYPDRLGNDPGRASAFWNRFEDFGAIFDAAALGQYLGGVDPRNTGGRDTRGFINETCIFDPSRYRFQWRVDHMGRRIPFAVDDGGEYRVNNLHIHCKNLARFAS